MQRFDTTRGLAAATITQRFARVWWQVAAVLIAGGATVVALDTAVNAPGPIWKRLIGCSLLAIAVVLVVAGLVIRRGNRALGSTMVAFGVVPGILPIVFFWYLPAVAIGMFGLAVCAFAILDASDARRASLPAAAVATG